MNNNIISKSIETLMSQNENGQFDQVIEILRVQSQEALKEEQAKAEAQKYGLTEEQYNEVIDAFKSDSCPLDDCYQFNNAQLKLLAHKWAEDKSLYLDDDGEVINWNDAYGMICSCPYNYFDIDKVIDDNFVLVNEDDLYQALMDARNEVYETDANGDLVLEEVV